METTPPSAIATHFFKLGHLGSVSYAIYLSPTGNDQQLLETELELRSKYPRILLTYNNKCLFYFHLTAEAVDLAAEYPNTINLKHKATVAVGRFTAPPKINAASATPGSASSPPNTSSGSSSLPQDVYLPFANVAFLKAVKKMLMYNLSVAGLVQLFGNYCVMAGDPRVVYIDPILFPNGDLMVSMLVKDTPKLDYPPPVASIGNSYKFSAAPSVSPAPSGSTGPSLSSGPSPGGFSMHLPATNSNGDLNFVIYTVPTAIRCHLFDPSSLAANIVTKNDNDNVAMILNLIRLATGKVYADDAEVSWVKLVPNLKQWNNHTSTISKFIHTIDNKKCILWPWDLCLLQYGEYEGGDGDLSIEEPAQGSASAPLGSAPRLSLISDFIDFNISDNHRRSLQNNKFPGSIGSAGLVSSIGAMGSVGPGSAPPHPQSLEVTPLVGDIFGDHDLFGSNDQGAPVEQVSGEDQKAQSVDIDLTRPEEAVHSSPKSPGAAGAASDDSMDIDDLFGDEDKPDEAEGPPAPEPATVGDDEDLYKLFGEKPDTEPPAVAPATVPEAEHTSELTTNAPPSSNGAVSSSLIDIPKDQMTVAKPTPGYRDPGAPVPITYTPNIASVYPASWSQSNPPSVPASGVGNQAQATPGAPAAPHLTDDKSVFSPILFNPIIKSNIDTKYGRGGKFYVEGKTIEEPARRRESIRETLVLGIDPINDKLSRKSRIEDISVVMSDDDDDSSESDADDDADHYGVKLPFRATATPPPARYSGSSAFPPSVNFASLAAAPPLGTTQQPAQSAIGSTSTAPPFSLDTPRLRKDSMRGGNSGLGFLGSPTVKGFSSFPFRESPFGASPDADVEVLEDENAAEVDSQAMASDSEVEEVGPTTAVVAPQTQATPESSSNYLPFILRGANVSTIPSKFLLNNQKPTAASFALDEEPGDDLAGGGHQMAVSHDNLASLLKFLHESLIFDLDLNHKQRGRTSAFELPPPEFVEGFSNVFPSSYRVSLAEFVDDFAVPETSELDDQLEFLGDITIGYGGEDDSDDYPGSDRCRSLRKLAKIEWEGVSSAEPSDGFASYKAVLGPLVARTADTPDDSWFKLSPAKTRVVKNNVVVNLNPEAISFWSYMNFSPLHAAKSFQVVVLGQEPANHSPYLAQFSAAVAASYRQCNLGRVTPVNLASAADIEPVRDGVVSVDADDYSAINRRLGQVAELIKLDLISKTNHFDFGQPLLVVIVNPHENHYNSMLQTSKILRNFKAALQRLQLPLVHVFSKVLPLSVLAKRDAIGNCRARPLGNVALTKLALNLYALCPDASGSLAHPEPRLGASLPTQLVREPPTRIHFKFMQHHSPGKHAAKGAVNDDIFLHLAFDRSLDKHWISCAWSDPYGLVTMTKSWYCGQGVDKPIGDIIDDIWQISADFCKRINDDWFSKTSSVGGKRFLVLTRINSIILDDELVHWKRLTTKHKDMALIVLSVNRSPMESFAAEASRSDEEPEENSANAGTSTSVPSHGPVVDHRESFFRSFARQGDSSPGALVTSPNFHSPQQFLNSGSAGFFSPSDMASVPSASVAPTTPVVPSSLGTGGAAAPAGDVALHDANSDVWGVIPHLPVPSSNSPSKLGMKIGYLVKRMPDQRLVLLEVSLLSCPNYWSLESLMSLILTQYKKLILLNDILGLNGVGHGDGLVPWHIRAATKASDYLVNIYVE
ncbi:mediator of RNA polymerase II transcription subunit 13 [Diutina catenulata]